MILERTEYYHLEEFSAGFIEEVKIIIEKAVDYALMAFNCRETDDLVVIKLNDYMYGLAKVIDYYLPIKVREEVILIDIYNKCYSSSIVGIKKGIFIA